MDTVIRQFYHINPDTLTDDEWSGYYANAIKLRRKQMHDLSTVIANGVITVLNQLNGRDNNTMDT